jgi:hypothetical protein
VVSDVDVEMYAAGLHAARKLIDLFEETFKKALHEHPKYVRAKEARAFAEGFLMNWLDSTKQLRAGTRYGTIHTVTRYSASCSAPDEFMDFVLAEKVYDMLDKKPNVTAVKAWVEEHHALPPGVQLSAIRRLSITAPKEPL